MPAGAEPPAFTGAFLVTLVSMRLAQIAGFVAVALLLVHSPVAVPAPALPVPEYALALVHVRDTARNGRGTAVFLQGGRWALTAAHVVSIPLGKKERLTAERITLYSAWDGRGYPATVRAVDAAADVALLDVGARNLPSLVVGSARGTAPSKPLALLGMLLPSGEGAGGPQRCDSRVVSKAKRNGQTVWLLAPCPDIRPGWSGGPVIDPGARRIVAIFHSLYTPKGKHATPAPAASAIPANLMQLLRPAAAASDPPPVPRPEHAERRLRLALQAIAAYSSGQYSQAVAPQRELIRLDPKMPRLRGELGEVLLLAGEPETALAEVQAAIAQDDDEPRWQVLLGHTQLRRGRTLAAEAAFREALRLRADDVDALLGLALAQETANRLGDAEKTFARVMRKARNHPLVLLRWGEYQERRGDYKEARKPLALAARLVGSEPSMLTVHLVYGRNLELNRKFREAEREYRLVIGIDDTNAVAYLYLANLLHKQRRPDQAQALIDRGLDLPNISGAMVQRFRELRARVNGGVR